MPEDRNFLDKIVDKAERTAEGLKRQYGLDGDVNEWPQKNYEPIGGGDLNLNPYHKTRGFLPPTKLDPLLDNEKQEPGGYTYKDWRGHQLSLNQSAIGTKEKFSKSNSLANNVGTLSINNFYSTRDYYSIFNDHSTDYFKHNLSDKTPIENPINGKSNLRLNNFGSTPFENNDPIIYGFDIIIDDISSPLLNGSIKDFIRNYSNISEISSKKDVYEDFKQQFIKFFKTKGTVSIDELNNSISNMGNTSDNNINKNSDLFQKDKTAHLNYYLKKITGIENLIEKNTTDNDKNFLTNYRTDKITLSLNEDVTMSMTTLAHLYKLLYWSKPNGKSIIPENLLRFNCDIIVSEVRNYNRVRNALRIKEDTELTGINALADSYKQLEIIKDNVTRNIYSLKECQFYFNNTAHGDTIDMGSQLQPKDDGSYELQFDYKYVTSKFERFTPTNNGFGQYTGYNSGTIWRSSNDNETIPVPDFLTIGDNNLNQNGVKKPFVFKTPKNDNINDDNTNGFQTTEEQEESSFFDNFKNESIKRAKELQNRLEDTAIRSASRELQTFVNTRTAILNKTLNKILNSTGVNGVRPPKNIYTDSKLNAGQRVFYDVRGELINFLGNSAGDALGGGGFTGGGLSPRQ